MSVWFSINCTVRPRFVRWKVQYSCKSCSYFWSQYLIFRTTDKIVRSRFSSKYFKKFLASTFAFWKCFKPQLRLASELCLDQSIKSLFVSYHYIQTKLGAALLFVAIFKINDCHFQFQLLPKCLSRFTTAPNVIFGYLASAPKTSTTKFIRTTIRLSMRNVLIVTSFLMCRTFNSKSIREVW